YKKLGVDNIYSLLTFYPRSYLDLTEPTPISETMLNENHVVRAMVFKKQGEQRIRQGLSLFKVFANDDSGQIVITIFNSKYMYDALVEGQEYCFYGKVTGNLIKREMTSPMFVLANEESLVRPTYHLTEGLSNKVVQGNIKEALAVWGDRLTDDIPSEIRQEYNLCKLRYSVENIHFPEDAAALKIAQKRLVFEELLILQLGLILLRRKNRKQTGITIENIEITEFYQALPFLLTNGQQDAINDGLADLKRNIPMNRLIQGDVGSGKTMVAAALCYACYKNGYQSAIMAPTQILADQHYETLSRQLEPLGIQCCLLTGSQTPKQRGIIGEGIKDGTYTVVIGTHALVQESVQFHSLGLVVTDEQHRFGVSQRAALSNKGDNPHLLVMSATPIPRTLALIIYGDLDVSTIKELPAGRIPIDTLSISTKKRARALSFIKKQIDDGRQAYIVCPLIDENESDLISTAEYLDGLKTTELANYQIGSLNGKLKTKEKEQLMASFKANEIQVLVSTTVVEVGVDVPNATVMMIENAERFGLSQLHQLRGRVGRGEHQSYCILVSDNRGEDNKKRLEVMKSTGDGFLIAEEDLKLRGPGDFFGLRQHGLPTLKLASLYDDMDALKQTQQLARSILDKDSNLKNEENLGLRRMVKRLFLQNEQIALN
ncbi:MAG: ATP-dependent DNA helicase RecG, partial [Oscillospiraceae bacterium]